MTLSSGKFREALYQAADRATRLVQARASVEDDRIGLSQLT